MIQKNRGSPVSKKWNNAAALTPVLLYIFNRMTHLLEVEPASQYLDTHDRLWYKTDDLLTIHPGIK